MAIPVQCPQCDAAYQIKDELAGKSIRCKSCGEIVPVRAPRRPKNEYEVDQDEDDEEPISRPGRSGSRSRSGIKVSGKKNRSRNDNSWGAWPWILGGAGALILVVVLVCAGMISSLREAAQGTPEQRREREAVVAAASQLQIPDAGPTNVLYPVEQYPLPNFPELGVWSPVPDSSVQVQTLNLQPPPDKILQPAFRMQMRVYMPPGEHAPGSLPLVLVAPAGSPLITGNGLDDPTYHDETLPYAEAGAVVIMYSLDGGIVDLDSATDAQLSMAYEQFRRAAAGTVNARAALEFALAKIPAVDPKKIVVAGHSSAGTLSMLFAAHESRLAAAIAYCPVTDVPTRMADMVNQLNGNSLFPEIANFVQKSSPRTHMAQTKCPVFLFHSFDDTNCPYTESVQYQDLLKSSAKDVTLSEPPAFGDHYQPMIDEGIPRAIVWLKSRGILAGQ